MPGTTQCIKLFTVWMTTKKFTEFNQGDNARKNVNGAEYQVSPSSATVDTPFLPEHYNLPEVEEHNSVMSEDKSRIRSVVIVAG